MQSGSVAKTASDTVTGSLSYISQLISGATSSGSYGIYVPYTYMNTAMATQLINVYGYSVSKRYSDIGSNREYYISWGSIDDPTPTPTPSPTATPLPATSTPTPLPATSTPTPLPATSTPLPATATPAPVSAYAYNYTISATDLASATGNTISGNNNAVFATTTQDENGSPATRKFTVAGSAYNHWLCSTVGITPTFGYYQDDILITAGLISTQTQTGAC